MIKAELSYNPYVREITVKFNGQSPHINSLVEKYQNCPLQDWNDDIPQIFHDEMNGYGFELDFSGTELDFEEIRNSFQKADVSEQDVQLILKDELECRERKIERICDFLNWINQNPYRKFDTKRFHLENHELFHPDFVCIVLHGDTDNPELKNISVEKVNNVSELDSTDLTHTPILYCIFQENASLLQKDLCFFQQRKDVSEEQIFFCIGENLKVRNIKHMLNDFGITEPVIVANINDEPVQKYFQIYPFSDYIASAVSVFHKVEEKLNAIIHADNEASRLKGNQTHEQLEQIAESIQNIEKADQDILSQADFEFPSEFDVISRELINQLSCWESRKTKLTDETAARNAADNFNTALQEYFAEFSLKLKEKTLECAESLHQNIHSFYSVATSDNSFDDHVNFPYKFSNITIENQTEHLLALKEEKYIEQKNNRLMQFFRQNESASSQNLILEIIYYYQTWRLYMIDTILPVIESMIEEQFNQLTEYAEQLTAVYHQKLQTMLNEKIKVQNSITANLSNDEMVLQRDNEWMKKFHSQLEKIERS